MDYIDYSLVQKYAAELAELVDNIRKSKLMSLSYEPIDDYRCFMKNLRDTNIEWYFQLLRELRDALRDAGFSISSTGKDDDPDQLYHAELGFEGIIRDDIIPEIIVDLNIHEIAELTEEIDLPSFVIIRPLESN